MSSLHSGVPVCKYTFLRGSSTQANNILQMQPSQEQKRNKAAAERMGGVGGARDSQEETEQKGAAAFKIAYVETTNPLNPNQLTGQVGGGGGCPPCARGAGSPCNLTPLGGRREEETGALPLALCPVLISVHRVLIGTGKRGSAAWGGGLRGRFQVATISLAKWR